MRLIGILTALALVAPAAAGADLADIDVAVHASIDKGDLPGAVVLVLHRDKIAYKKSFGQRMKLPQPTLMSDDTVFDLASLTKPIATALAVMFLIEDGKLRPDDPIAKHLPAFARKETEAITIAQLLTHTAGFIADNPLKDYQSGKDQAWQNLFALDPPTQTAVLFLSNRVHPDGKGNVTNLRGRIATIAGKALAP